MPRPLVILGAIGNCLDIADAVLAQCGEGAQAFDLRGFLDDDPARQRTQVHGLPVLGPLSAAREMPDALFVSGIGSPRSYRDKATLIQGLGVDRSRFATVIHPSAVAPPSAHIGRGSVILAHCTICANVEIGDHVMMLPNCVIGHDTTIAEWSILAAGVTVSGSVRVGRGCYLGAGSAIRESISLGDGCLLGIGAVAIRDATANNVLVGNPARAARRVGSGAQ